jgi:hypothetical protein
VSTDLAAYFGLFSAALLAATILPAQSEAVLAMMIITNRYPLAALIGVASFGSVLGSVVNWMLGRGIEHYRNCRWFPVSAEKLDRAEGWYRGKLGSDHRRSDHRHRGRVAGAVHDFPHARYHRQGWALSGTGLGDA